ncbi:MAG: T9SS type A sorting domain-containing protein, partial [Bacteroidales bacterium]|nr:T9SS type A sorting domain-containing protein [Bacteroidales bacterium]
VSYYYHNSGSHTPVGSSNYTLRQATNANSCASSLCGIQRFQGDGLTALEQYLSMAEEYVAIVETLRGVETCHGASLQTDAPDQQDETDDADLIARLSDLSAAMGDLARTEIRNILNDSVPDMALLKRWYATIMETQNFASPQMADSTIPVAAYQLAETYSMEGDLAAAAALLSSLPQQFIPNEAARNEYANYMALQQLRETVAGNWYTMTDTDIAAMQQVAEYDNGRAARMAKEILCFFHHICYEDEMVWDLDGIGERALRGDGACPIAATDDGLRLHPNPTGGTLTVESTSPIRTLTVYDLAGRVMMTAEGGANNHSPLLIMDVSSLPNGIYLLRAVTDSGVETGRFVKN